MSDLLYVWEKLHNGVETLILAEGGLRERVHHAWMDFHMLETADLPADMAHEFDEIEALLMRHVDEAPGGTGGVLHTLMRLQDEEVRDLALRILKLYEEVKELADRP